MTGEPTTLPERVQHWADLLRPILTSTQEVVDLAGTPALLDYVGTEGADPNSYDCMPSAIELEGPAADRERVIEFLCALAEHQAAALAAAEAERDALREAVGTIGAGVEIARQQGGGNAHMDTIYRIACEAMGVQS